MKYALALKRFVLLSVVTTVGYAIAVLLSSGPAILRVAFSPPELELTLYFMLLVLIAVAYGYYSAAAITGWTLRSTVMTVNSLLVIVLITLMAHGTNMPAEFTLNAIVMNVNEVFITTVVASTAMEFAQKRGWI